VKIKKAVITAAGLGTRMLPAPKSIPKEMLPILDKPALQFQVEECIRSGITDILIIISRGKQTIEDHFDFLPELDSKLRVSGKAALADELRAFTDSVKISYVRQAEQLGLGNAVLCAEGFTGGEPYALVLGDDVIIGETPAVSELCAAFESHGKAVVGIKRVPDDWVKRYGTVRVKDLPDGIFAVDAMQEKVPFEQAYSNYAILGRYVLTPDIYPLLKKQGKGAGGEIQLTDSLAKLAGSVGMIGVPFSGERYDMGNKNDMLRAIVDVALSRDDVKDEFLKLIKGKVNAAFPSDLQK
jgi:UTP--glucose-1-phosphate uridylyltransferase